MKVINPATEEVIETLEVDSISSIQEKFKKSKSTQREWSQVPISEKKSILSKFNEFLKQDIDELAKIMTLETGKPFEHSKNEIRATPSRVQYFIDNFEEATKSQNVLNSGGIKEEISFDPLGVIVNISAWNYPYFVGTNVFVPALLTGNTVLYKPSEFSTLTGLAIAEKLWKSGIQKDVFQVVIGTGEQGAALLDLDINGVFFTGSKATGEKILQSLKGRMIKTQFELGGKDPVYFCEDISPEAAAQSALEGAFYNAGQSCCAIERLYIHEKIYEDFIKYFINAVKDLKVGDPMDPSTFVGPLTRDPQRDILEFQIADAKSKGAKLEVGGSKTENKGYYFQPTVVTGVNHSMDIMIEESFGPIIGVQKVKDDSEAIQLMNDTKYGLTSGVYTKDENRARKILSQLNSGTVYWNCCDRVSPFVPWTGRKGSGLGSTLSHIGIQSFVQPKAWQLRNP